MMMPIVVAYSSNRKYSENEIEFRINSLIQYLSLDKEDNYICIKKINQNAGLIFINYKDSKLNIPLYHASKDRCIISGYIPFGVSSAIDFNEITKSDYLISLVNFLQKDHTNIRSFAPPQIFCDLNCKTNTLDIYNDYRGFGKLYEYKSDFGTVWSNKISACILVAGCKAELDDEEIAHFAATSMFIGYETGYKNISLCKPGTRISVNIKSNDIKEKQISNNICGLKVFKDMPSYAISEISNAMHTWFTEYKKFINIPTNLHLSGGRDSRVVAAFALKEDLDNFNILSYSPPKKDAELALKLIELSNTNYKIKCINQRDESVEKQKKLPSLFEHARKILRLYNSDISIVSHLITFCDTQITPPESFTLSGAQGEIAHNCYYTDANVKQKDGLKKRISSLLSQISTKSLGINEDTGKNTLSAIQNFYFHYFYSIGDFEWSSLDLFYLFLWLNRQWGGATGAYDTKTPLTIYPYVKYCFGQSTESKLQSLFIREIIRNEFPQWGNIAFFHELPKEEQNDFHSSYPTYWEMNKGDEIAETILLYPYLFNFFEKRVILEGTLKLRSEYKEMQNADLANWNKTMQKMIWIAAMQSENKALYKIIEKYS